MWKRLGLMIGTFLLLLFVYGVYRIITDTHTTLSRPRTTATRPIERIGASTSPADPDAGRELNLESRDKDGRLTAVYKADTWRRHKDGSITLHNPYVTLYQGDGQQIVIRSAQGEIYAEEVGKTYSYQVKRGRLTGGEGEKVHIDILRVPGQDERTIHIEVEDAAIDNDLLQLTTDKSVEVRSSEADIFGTGLTVRWNEKPNELRDLRLERGRKMVIRNIPEELDAIRLPGATRGKSPASGAVSLNLPMADDGYPVLATRPGTRPASRPAPAAREEGMNLYQAQFVDSADGILVKSGSRTMGGAGSLSLTFSWDRADRENARRTPATRAATRPAPSPATQGAPAESMEITWDGPLVLKPTGRTDKEHRKDYSVAASGRRVTLTDKDTVATCKTFRFDSLGDAKSPKQTGLLEGTESEPAVLTMENRSTISCPLMKFDRQGQFADLIGPGEMTTQGEERGMGVSPVRPAGILPANLSGSRVSDPAAEASQRLASQEKEAGLRPAATAESEPRLLIDAGGTPATRKGKTPSPRTPSTAPVTAQKITWAESVHVAFEEIPGGRGEAKQHIRAAEFRGKVHLQELASAKGHPKAEKNPLEGGTPTSASEPTAASQPAVANFILCDNLDVTMMPAQQGRDVRLPQTAHAWGRVTARQEASDIACRDLVVKFQEEAVAGADGKVRLRARPADLNAQGSDEEFLTVVDASDPAQVLTASARTLVSKIDTRHADLEGTTARPASVRQGKNEVEGPRIRVDNSPLHAGPDAPRKEFLTVLGAGKAKFLSKQDLQGQPLPGEKPVTATWSHKMEYEGYGSDTKDNKELRENKDLVNRLAMVGNVELVQETDTMTCGSMQVIFDKAPPKTAVGAPAPMLGSAPATRPARDRRTIALQGFGRKSIKRIVAKDGVEMLSEKHDEQGRLTQLVRVTGKDLEYRVLSSNTGPKPDISVEILGKGYMYQENYRPPQPSSPPADEAKLEHPSQTVFAWKDYMKWVRAVPEGVNVSDLPLGTPSPQKSTVTMSGDVQMAHRSLDKLILKPNLNIPPLPKMTGGRNTKVDCQRMIAEFAPVIEEAKDKPPKTPATTATRPSSLDMAGGLGRLEKFIARTDVVMTEGPTEIHAQQVEFMRAPQPAKPDPNLVDNLEIRGYLGDEKPAFATLLYEDPSGKKMPPVTAPIIECKLRKQQIVQVKAQNVSGAGPR